MTNGLDGLDELLAIGARAGGWLVERGETVAVAEGSAGGLVSAALLAVPGASAYYLGGTVVYTAAALGGFLASAVARPAGLRGATEDFARYLSSAVSTCLGSTWGIGEAGAAGPPNRYGDPAGHSWLAVAGPTSSTRRVLTGLDDRQANMVAFAVAALTLLVDTLQGDAPT
jgi:nicotinamide-nucleotide amidase